MESGSRVPVKQMGDFSVMDSEFDNIRSRFDSEMRRMEDEMARFRSELISRESAGESFRRTSTRSVIHDLDGVVVSKVGKLKFCAIYILQ